MNKRILNSKLLKTLPYLILILVLVVSSCGIKHSINNVCKVENTSTKSQKATTSCQFVQLANDQIYQEVSLKQVIFHETNSSIISIEYSEESDSNFFSNAGSIPLYILYKQMRSDLI